MINEIKTEITKGNNIKQELATSEEVVIEQDVYYIDEHKSRCKQIKCEYYINGNCKKCKDCGAESYEINKKCDTCYKCENVPNNVRFDLDPETLAKQEKINNVLKGLKGIVDNND